MNFEINTQNKTIILLSETTLEEVESLKQWIGQDWQKWTLQQRSIVLERERWYPFQLPPTMPYNPLTPHNPYQVWCTSDRSQFRLENVSTQDLYNINLVK